MSPDDVFAAQMWPWPDPLLKRDPMGRVMFVNAAFLQLYGGRIENWAGQVVQGWPAPNPQGLPYRFETRAGEGPGEIIYDWVEVTMADGNALAIARDVTVFHQAPVPHPALSFDASAETSFGTAAPAPQNHEPSFSPPPAPNFAPAFSHQPEQAPASAPLTSVSAFENGSEHAQEPAYQEPAYEVPAYDDSAALAFTPAPEPVTAQITAPEIHVRDLGAPPVQAPAFEAAPEYVAALALDLDEPRSSIDANLDRSAQAQAFAPASQTAPETAPETSYPPAREFERRALPLESDSAVLGTNWRDAVIAKAIGNDLPQAETRRAAPQPEPEPEPAQSEPGEGLRILLAEDNAINALLTRTLLEAEGCIVETVEDGQLAVEAVKANSYDLVFMDMRMPNMDGLEATRKIRALGARADKLPIIALTANAFDDDRNACFDSGMNDFMTKPVSSEELTAMVATWTGQGARSVAA